VAEARCQPAGCGALVPFASVRCTARNRSDRQHVRSGADSTVWKRATHAPRPAVLWHALQHSHPHGTAISSKSDRPAKGTKNLPLCLLRVQTAAGRSCGDAACPGFSANCPKNQAKSLRLRDQLKDDLLSIRRGTSHSNRESMAKTHAIQWHASTASYGVPVSVEVCRFTGCVNLR
jgi:proteasome lid subunit RPN8/RPN11